MGGSTEQKGEKWGTDRTHRLLGSTPAQHVTVKNTIGNCERMASICVSNNACHLTMASISNIENVQ